MQRYTASTATQGSAHWLSCAPLLTWIVSTSCGRVSASTACRALRTTTLGALACAGQHSSSRRTFAHA
jgi:hypothetical protein